ncbi:hypothetical protein H4R34_002944 [Dimargaris verticillata]|uniref:Glucosidase 2 subunit beta n=1 Tax=Dimargaris verticillata TaxID=2761393 RepID=A0A9W8ECF9_9FUNG|nr:hypothetical protein H4R34_002944 [Dimargaris verticillata]
MALGVHLAQGSMPVDINRKPPSPTYGAAPEVASLYQPDAQRTRFACFDGSKVLDFAQVNDNYCDCPDGSDEPGSSACRLGEFYCQNRGHISARLRASQVNDGVCEPECCDGSDEYNGLVTCPNRCTDLAHEYQAQQAQLKQLHAQGSALKQIMLQEARDLKVAKEVQLARLREGLVTLEGEIMRLKDLERVQKEARDQSESEQQFRQSPGTQLSQATRALVADLKSNLNNAYRDLDALTGVLRDLKKNHNPNYHDMAVKQTIAAYDDFIKVHPRYQSAADHDDNPAFNHTATDHGDSQSHSLLTRLDQLVELGNRVEAAEEAREAHTAGNPVFTYFSYLKLVGLDASGRAVANYIKSLVEKATAVLGLAELQESSEPVSSDSQADSDFAYKLEQTTKSLQNAESKQRTSKNDITSLEAQLTKDYGPDDMFLKAADDCIDREVGEYKYTLCFLGKATQKSMTGHSNVNLGKFSKWGITTDDKSNPAYYQEQVYDHGDRCWNGPLRSVKVHFECGTHTQILQVSEPAKCEYQMKVSTPLACPLVPGFAHAGKVAQPNHDEL